MFGIYSFFRYFSIKSILIFFFISINTYAQADWIDYLIKKDKGIMSVSVNLDYVDHKPNYKNLLIIATHYKDCMANGFPKEKGLQKLYTFSDLTEPVINKITKNRLVGIITYQCLGFDVYYVKDTIGIRDNMNTLFENRFKSSKNYLIIKRDKKWNYYFMNLFADSISEGFLADQQLLIKMVTQGDDLEGIRKVNHWVSFNSLKKRKLFIDKIKKFKFNIDSISYNKEKKYTYELQFSRKDFIYPRFISSLTGVLQLFAGSLGGIYKGWGTEIRKREED